MVLQISSFLHKNSAMINLYLQRLPMPMIRVILLLLGCVSMQTALAAIPKQENFSEQIPVSPYRLSNAPSFNMTISQFRETFNIANPKLLINEYRTIKNHDKKEALTHAASKINHNLYTSAALENETGNIKTLQITWLPVQGSKKKVSWEKAVAYMTALICFFEPNISQKEAFNHLCRLLKQAKGSRYFSQVKGTLRFVISDNGGNGLTFAIEPIKLSLQTPYYYS